MGTNYYLYDKEPCECCGRGDDPKHIGKSSAGWHFSLHVDAEQHINNLGDWKRLFESGVEIRDEYGQVISVGEMLDIITNRSREKTPGGWSPQILKANGAEPGLNNLVRHKIGGRCIGHGDGTWDLITGEFS